MKRFLSNFSIHEHKLNGSNIIVHNSSVMGCKDVKSDYMLSFGPVCTPRGSNNQPLLEEKGVVDIFISKEQAIELYHRLGDNLTADGVVLNAENKKIS